MIGNQPDRQGSEQAGQRKETAHIVKKRLNLDASLYTLLQILSLTLFEKLPLQQAFMAKEYTATVEISCKQLNLLGF